MPASLPFDYQDGGSENVPLARSAILRLTEAEDSDVRALAIRNAIALPEAADDGVAVGDGELTLR